VTCVLLLFTLAMLPLTVASVFNDVLGPPSGAEYPLSPVPHSEAAATHTDLRVAAINLNEVQQTVTLRVTGYHICPTGCDWNDRVRLFAVSDDSDMEGFPPSVTITLPPSLDALTQNVELPVEGLPLRYPFDEYQLRLGVALDRVQSDGTIQAVPPAEAVTHLFVTMQEELAQHTMDAPIAVDPGTVQPSGTPIHYAYVALLNFHRLLYVRVLAVLLVLLVTAAAAYAVFLRPLQDLVINAGALIIGIWGIRSVLTPSTVTYVTAVDLSLSVVILFLLGAITVRAAVFLYRRSDLRTLRSRRD